MLLAWCKNSQSKIQFTIFYVAILGTRSLLKKISWIISTKRKLLPLLQRFHETRIRHNLVELLINV